MLPGLAPQQQVLGDAEEPPESLQTGVPCLSGPLLPMPVPSPAGAGPGSSLTTCGEWAVPRAVGLLSIVVGAAFPAVRGGSWEPGERCNLQEHWGAECFQAPRWERPCRLGHRAARLFLKARLVHAAATADRQGRCLVALEQPMLAACAGCSTQSLPSIWSHELLCIVQGIARERSLNAFLTADE